MFRVFAHLSFVVFAVVATLSEPAQAESFDPPPGKRWVTIASSTDLDEAIGIARRYGGEARVVRAANGWYAAVLEPRSGTLDKIRSDLWMSLPKDTVLSRGKTYIETVWRMPPQPGVTATVKKDKPSVARIGAFEVKLTRDRTKDGWTARVVGTEGGKTLFDLKHRFEEAADYDSNLRLVELDRGNGHPEVMFDAFSGGAHCCTTTVVLSEASPGVWTMADLGQADSEPVPDDVDGDGIAELVSGDDSFSYLFASYAESVRPPLIQKFGSGRLRNVTKDPAFRRRVVQDLRSLEFEARQDPEVWRNNGYLAGWVATKQLLGEGGEAWARMLPLYDRSSDWKVEICSDGRKVENCPEASRRKLDFPDALRRHLVANGYGAPEGTASNSTAAAMPSFEDAKAAFLALPIDRRRDIQVLLAATGQWPNVAVDGFGEKLFAAIKAFQASVGRSATGVLTDGDQEALRREASPLLRRWGLSRVTDLATGASLWVPKGVASSTSPIENGMQYGAPPDPAVVFFVGYQGFSVDAAFPIILGNLKDMTIDFKVLKPGFFVISSHDGASSQYSRFSAVPGGVAGFTIIWSSASDIRGERLATVMSDLFRADNELGIRRSPPLPLTEVAIAPAAPNTARPPDSGSQGSSGGASSGTGFFVAQDAVVTNQHVVDGCSSVTVSVDGQPKPGTVIASDETNDLALVKTEARSKAVAHLRMGVRLGEDVAAFGFPLSGLLASGNFTRGSVAATAGLRDDTRHLQISAPVQPGNSGGPLLDESGNVVGVVHSKINAVAVAMVTNDIPQNVNFAIKAAILASFLEAKGIEYQVGSPGEPLKGADLAERAQSIAAAIECRR
ncbi:serine protease [Oharaeibacter diazotrophicus]|nr:serine protease [Oharaeibacter diazotrophicus]